MAPDRHTDSQRVDLSFSCAFGISVIAAMRGVAECSVQRDWEKARLLFHRACEADLTA